MKRAILFRYFFRVSGADDCNRFRVREWNLKRASVFINEDEMLDMLDNVFNLMQ